MTSMRDRSNDLSADWGYYEPDSLTWRLSRERALLVGGPRALLLQLAHPLVAAGVAQHSSFRSDPVTRLRRTLDGTLGIVFGTRADAQVAAGRINASHRSVKGTLPQAAGRYPVGAPYDATDPELLLWVHATLVDTTLEVYPRFVAPLTRDELEWAYQESKVAARLLGVPDEVVPADLDAFWAYMDETIASDRIAVAPFQKELAGDVLYPSLRFVPRLAHRPMVAVTTALLPTKLRKAFGLELTRSQRRTATYVRAAVHGILPVLPRVVRYQPQARRAEARLKGRR
jgi:uncharacterized protein (DUF2236 family)